MPLQIAEPVPYQVMDVDEESVQDSSALYALSFGVCAFAVAGAVMRTPTVRANRTMVPFRTGGWNRTAAPVMQLQPKLKGSVGEGPNQTNYSDRSSVGILGIQRKPRKKV